MYWPIGTPRIYATSTNPAPAQSKVLLSHDGLDPAINADSRSLLSVDSALSKPTDDGSQSDATSDAATNQPPPTPFTPRTPAVNSVEHDVFHDATAHYSQETSLSIPSDEPVLALRVSKTGHLFAVITETTITIWQTKVGISY